MTRSSHAVVEGAQLRCSMGNAHSELAVPIRTRLRIADKNVASVSAIRLHEHIRPFGMCSAANAPTPCVPDIANPWSPGAVTETEGLALGADEGDIVLTDDSTCRCRSGGLVQITTAGQSHLKIDRSAPPRADRPSSGRPMIRA